ncbi:MAG: hypothetical protein HQ530_02560 [Parcubacteria group bacterium]|nr:hypothetical protein [Parcubacteria group bacterium]
MLIHQFNLFLQEASELPASFWSYNYYLAQKSFRLQLEEIAEKVNQDTKSAQDLESFINILKKEEINELELAQGFASLGKIFTLTKINSGELEIFQSLAQKFLKRTQTFASYDQKRQAIKKNLAEDRQSETDLNLFKNEGISYCLEYYLAIFKNIEDFTTEQEKKDFIEAPEVNLGFGDLPGIKEDFVREESLTKFILLILNDEIREELITDYYRCKIVIDNEEDSEKIEKALKQFICQLLLSFDKQGVEQLTSLFFKPYGGKPAIKDLITTFSND